MLDQIFASQTIGFSDLPTVLFSMLLAAVFGFLISWIYRRNYRGVMYSGNFSFTLIMMTLVTTPVVLCIRSSLALSMGMVGALSIVRFRTAIKDPLDIAFLFWSIGAGIILAAGMIPLAVIGSVCIGIILLVFVGRTSNTHPYMVVLSCTDHDVEMKAKDFISKNAAKTTVKSKSAVKGAIELNIEVRLKNDNTDFINILSELPGVNSAVIVSYNGDYMG